jgi:rhodanese-related sulfurtransferase
MNILCLKETNTSWITSTIRDRLSTLREKLSALLKLRAKPPLVTEDSTLSEIASHHPRLWVFLEKKYQLKAQHLDPHWSLKFLSKKFDLPPAQILFMEIQIDGKQSQVIELTATEAKQLLEKEKDLALLDVREGWERNFGSLPGSQVLERTLLDTILGSWSKDRPLLLYCHFGVRSSDAANYFSEEGFEKVFIIKGGIDAWSQQVDPLLPRYTGSYC